MKYLKIFEQWATNIVGPYEITESVVTEDNIESVGREFQHIEDLVYIYGISGIQRALERLETIGQDNKHMEVKWDGSPAIIFGRDENGTFHFGDKYSKEIVDSGEKVYQQYVGRSGANVTDDRRQFASGMGNLWTLYEQATPKNFRGYIEAGLLYKTTPPLNKQGEYVFQPNTVIYNVSKDSALGKRIGASTTGAAATAFFDNLPALGGSRITTDLPNIIKGVGSQDVVIVPPKYATDVQVKIPQEKINQLKSFVSQSGNKIEKFITPSPEWTATYPDQATATKKWREVIYKYVNSQVDSPGGLESLGGNMAQWAETDPILTKARRPLAIEKIKQDQDGMKATFLAVRAIMHLKDTIVDQMENPTLGSLGIRAELPGGVSGGEGFVSDPMGGSQPLKFVKRGTFTAANRQKGRVSMKESYYVAGVTHKYVPDLKKFEQTYGKLLVLENGKYSRNRDTEQRFMRLAHKNKIDTNEYYYALNEQIEQTCYNKSITESISFSEELGLKSLFESFSKTGEISRAKSGDKLSLLMLTAEDYGPRNRTITLEGFKSPKTVEYVTRDQIIFEDGTRYPSEPVGQTRLWRQIALFENSNQLNGALTVTLLKLDKIPSKNGDWKVGEIFITENKNNNTDKTAVVGWGRGMGHTGHMYLAESVISYADKIGATPFFFVSETVGKDDPLDPKTKLSIYKTVFPKHKKIFHTGKNPIEILQQVYDSGYRNVVFMVGADQRDSFQFLARPTKSTGELPVPFDSIKVISRQESGSKTANLEGPRATPMREILRDPRATYQQKFEVWRRDMPEQLSDSAVKKLMNMAATRMGVELDTELAEADPPPQGGLSSPIPGQPQSLQPQPSRQEIAAYQREMRAIRRFMGRDE